MSIAFAQKFGVVLVVASSVVLFACDAASAKAEWIKHVVHQGAQSLTAIAGDFTRDGLPDIIANAAVRGVCLEGSEQRRRGRLFRQRFYKVRSDSLALDDQRTT